MALQFAFQLGSLAFATTLLRSAWESPQFVNGLYESTLVGLIFFGLGYVLGEICRHLVEELVVRELALAEELQNTEQTVVDSSSPSPRS